MIAKLDMTLCTTSQNRNQMFMHIDFMHSLYVQSWKYTKLIHNTVKPVLSGHSKIRPKMVFKTNYRLMLVKCIAECSKGSFCSKGSILQYFRPSSGCHLSLRSLFCPFFEWPLKTGFTVCTCKLNALYSKLQ